MADEERLRCESCGRDMGPRTRPDEKVWCWPPLPTYGRGSRIDWMSPCEARVTCEMAGISGLPARDPLTGSRLDQDRIDALS